MQQSSFNRGWDMPTPLTAFDSPNSEANLPTFTKSRPAGSTCMQSLSSRSEHSTKSDTHCFAKRVQKNRDDFDSTNTVRSTKSLPISGDLPKMFQDLNLTEEQFQKLAAAHHQQNYLRGKWLDSECEGKEIMGPEEETSEGGATSPTHRGDSSSTIEDYSNNSSGRPNNHHDHYEEDAAADRQQQPQLAGDSWSSLDRERNNKTLSALEEEVASFLQVQPAIYNPHTDPHLQEDTGPYNPHADPHLQDTGRHHQEDTGRHHHHHHPPMSAREQEEAYHRSYSSSGSHSHRSKSLAALEEEAFQYSQQSFPSVGEAPTTGINQSLSALEEEVYQLRSQQQPGQSLAALQEEAYHQRQQQQQSSFSSVEDRHQPTKSLEDLQEEAYQFRSASGPQETPHSQSLGAQQQDEFQRQQHQSFASSVESDARTPPQRSMSALQEEAYLCAARSLSGVERYERDSSARSVPHQDEGSSRRSQDERRSQIPPHMMDDVSSRQSRSSDIYAEEESLRSYGGGGYGHPNHPNNYNNRAATEGGYWAPGEEDSYHGNRSTGTGRPSPVPSTGRPSPVPSALDKTSVRRMAAQHRNSFCDTRSRSSAGDTGSNARDTRAFMDNSSSTIDTYGSSRRVSRSRSSFSRSSDSGGGHPHPRSLLQDRSTGSFTSRDSSRRGVNRSHSAQSWAHPSVRRGPPPVPRPPPPPPPAKMVTICPGVRVPLRGYDETLEAVANQFHTDMTCFGCMSVIHCIANVKYTICPHCEVISPLEQEPGFEGVGVDAPWGLGIGFTKESYWKMQNELSISRELALSRGY